MKAQIVAFGFGEPSIPKIAQIATKKALELNAPIYTQKDVIIEEEGIIVQYAPQKADKPPPTWRIAKGAVKMARMYGNTDLWIVAAKPHIWRARRDLSDRNFFDRINEHRFKGRID